MLPTETRTHILCDSIRRLATNARWYRRQRGRKEAEYIRNGNELTTHAMAMLAEVQIRADRGEKEAIDWLPMAPTLAIQDTLV